MNLKLTRENLIKETIRMQIVEVTYSSQQKDLLTHTIIKSKPSVLVIPKKGKQLVFIKEFRSTTENYYLEFPAGLIEKEESLKEAAYRETKEETGLLIENIKVLATKTLMDISVSNEELTILLGDVLKKEEPKLDAMEIISKDLIYLDEEEVYQKLKQEIYQGKPFHDNLFLSGATRYALLVYFDRMNIRNN